MSDKEVVIIFEKMPDEFTARVNAILSSGNWRVAETEMSPTDHHYWAMLIRSEAK